MSTPQDSIAVENLPVLAESALLAVLDSLKQLSSSMLAGFPDVRRWDQTDDIFQQAAIKLLLALRESPPETQRHLQNLVALQVRRTLIDLGRRYSCRVAMSQQRWTPSLNDRSCSSMLELPASSESDPYGLIEWVELHEAIDKLDIDEREVFQLIWYLGRSKDEVAELLDVDVRTVQRRWRAAREVLASRYAGLPPL